MISTTAFCVMFVLPLFYELLFLICGRTATEWIFVFFIIFFLRVQAIYHLTATAECKMQNAHCPFSAEMPNSKVCNITIAGHQTHNRGAHCFAFDQIKFARM